jgi:hypothetical protein
MEANMKHTKHSKPLRAAQIALVLLAMLAASTAAAQTPAQTAAQSAAGQPRTPPPRAAQVTPAPPGPSYGPVLHPQPLKSEPGAQPEQTPQAQEEKAGAVPPGHALDADPSARPAPQTKDPAKTDKGKEHKKGARRSARLSAAQRVDIVPPAAPGPFQPLAAPPPVQPVALMPGPARINSCTGGICRDTGGGTYNTGVGNAAVNDQGRLCTRSGETMQCF